jgi:hypothetical protein
VKHPDPGKPNSELPAHRFSRVSGLVESQESQEFRRLVSVHSIWVSAILPSRALLDPPLHQTAPRIGLTI